MPSTSPPEGSDDEGAAEDEEWVVLDMVEGRQLGQPMRRLRERVFLAEYR